MLHQYVGENRIKPKVFAGLQNHPKRTLKTHGSYGGRNDEVNKMFLSVNTYVCSTHDRQMR